MRKEVFELVSPKATQVHEGSGPHILLVDAGCKDNICRSLLERGAKVTRAPYFADIVALAKDADGVLLGNGPGDPKDLGELTRPAGYIVKHCRDWLHRNGRRVPSSPKKEGAE